MSLIIQNEQKKHLEYFSNQKTQVLVDVLQNFSSGTIPITDSDHDKGSQALLKLLIDAKKANLSEEDFASNILSFTEDQRNFLVKFYKDEVLEDLIPGSDGYSFRDLEWRLEAKIASRFSHNLPIEPKILMKLHLDKEKSLKHRLTLSEESTEESRKDVIVQTDANNLIHIIEQLESAKTAIGGNLR